MKKLLNMKFVIGGLILLTALTFILACGKDSTEPENQGPDIPPLSTFLIDFSAFPHGDTTLAKPADIFTYVNWGYAALNVWVWNAVITAHAVVPVAAYVESFNHTPQQQEDGSWVWSYSFQVGEDTYTAELHASTDSLGINWEMYLSKAGDFTDFLWYSGQHNLLYTEGTWTLYKEPSDPVEYVGVEWQRNLTNNTANITYTNIEEGSAGYGGYITYGTTTDPDYDAFYDIYIIETEHGIDIAWNLDSRAGQVYDEIYFEDTQWHCWDETLSDAECP
jgi:hypothetical protein